jgi:hypothetical protein
MRILDPSHFACQRRDPGFLRCGQDDKEESEPPLRLSLAPAAGSVPPNQRIR